MINPLLADAMKRRGEAIPADGVIAMSNGVTFACAGGEIEKAAVRKLEVDYDKVLTKLRNDLKSALNDAGGLQTLDKQLSASGSDQNVKVTDIISDLQHALREI